MVIEIFKIPNGNRISLDNYAIFQLNTFNYETEIINNSYMYIYFIDSNIFFDTFKKGETKL